MAVTHSPEPRLQPPGRLFAPTCSVSCLCHGFYASGHICAYEPIMDFLSDNEDWTSFGLMDVEEDISTPEEASALREFVEAYNTSTPVPSDEAARRLMSLSEDRVPCDGDFDKGLRVAWLLWGAGIKMPQYQVAILVLVDAAMALPRLDATPEQGARFTAGKLERWRSMENFWDIWQETYMRYEEYRYPAERLDSGDCFPGYGRANAFTAHRLVMHPPDLYYTTELSRAFWQIRFTLEQDPWNYATQEEKKVNNPVSLRWPWAHEAHITMLNTNVHGLVPFIVIAGDIMYRYTDREMLSRRFAETYQENHQHNTREFWQAMCPTVKPPEAYLWKGDIWLTRDRWAFWKERLIWVSEQNELLQRTRDEASMLVQLMTEIESREA